MNRNRPPARPVVGVVIPVHDEEALLPLALDSLEGAMEALPSECESRVAIVLDDCGDASTRIALRWARAHDATVVWERERNVGAARGSGCTALLDRWRHVHVGDIWLATTDADSRVPNDWLTAQLAAYRQGADLWAGRVRVGDWSLRSAGTKDRWLQEYANEEDPVHGASLGFSARMYVELGGFRRLPTGEDRDLHHRARQRGFRILHDGSAEVETSARHVARAPLGFAHALSLLVDEDLAPTA